MARPLKESLDYFPLDVSALEDPKLRTARQEFGYMATVIYLELLCMTYRDKGYYLVYNEKTRDDVLWSIASSVLAGKYQPQTNTIALVIDQLVASGLFSGDLFQSGILTSRRIQETYYSATLSRRAISIKWEYWLLDQRAMEKLSMRSAILSEYVNRSNNGVIEPNNEGFCGEEPHKGKESKSNKSKLNQSKNEKERFVFRYAERFEELFGDTPSTSHLTGICNLVEDGKSESAIMEALDGIRPGGRENPEKYAYAVCKRYEPKQSAPDPDAPLADWEQDWLDEMRKRKERRDAQQSDPHGPSNS